MSNDALQSLVKQQSLETEKFNSNLLPPLQTVVLVSNGGEGEVNHGTGMKSSGSAILPLDGFSETALSSLSLSSSSSSSSLISHSVSVDSIRRPNEIIDDLKRNNHNVDREEEEEEEEEIVPESLQEELRRLENTIREEHETSERIMAQNIALLADLEAAQRMVRELRSGKNALALQLRNALQLAENR